MIKLLPETKLERAAELRLWLPTKGGVEIKVGAGPIQHADNRALEVLSIFARPLKFQEGMARLTPRAVGAADWVELTKTIKALVKSGALIATDETAPKIFPDMRTFGGAPVHIRMLDDRIRTSRWIAAITAVVRPGDVVVEVGTGTGVLAIAAARAGAEHVYTIEAGEMAPVAREVVRANGMADRVTVVEGWSTAVTLPERGDVFISETIGNTAFDENLLGIARDAVQRHLRPGARMIPESLRFCALPVQAPDELMRRQAFVPEAIRDWREWYGIDFDVLSTLSVDYRPRSGFLRPAHALWPVLGEPVLLARAPCVGDVSAEMQTSTIATLAKAGKLNAFVLFFESQLAPGISCSTDPRLPAEKFPRSWANPTWLVPSLTVRPGDQVRVDFSWRDAGGHRWNVAKVDASDSEKISS